jgi:hypothetical protein
MPFDPTQPFAVVDAPAFDPTKPFESLQTVTPPDWNQPARSPEELAARNFQARQFLGLGPEGTADTMGAALTRPLIELPRVTAQGVRDAMDVIGAAGTATMGGGGAVNPEASRSAEALMESPSSKPGTASKVTAGLVNVGKSVPESFTSPLGMATLGQGSLPATAQRLISAGFAADMARQVPELARQAGKASVESDAQANVEALGQLAVQGLLTAGAAKHALQRAKPLDLSVPSAPIPPKVFSEFGGEADSARAEAPVPETPATLAAQLDRFRAGERRAVLFTPGTADPILQPGEVLTPTEAGNFLHRPEQLNPESIMQAVRENRIGEILDYGVASKPSAASTTVITQRAANGTPVNDVVTDAANAPKVQQALTAQARPGDSLEVRPAEAVIAERVATPTKSKAELAAENLEATRALAKAKAATPNVESSNIGSTPANVESRAREIPVDVSPEEIKAAAKSLPSERPPDLLDTIEEHFPNGVHFNRADFGETLKRAIDGTTGERKDLARKLMSHTRGEPADNVLRALQDLGVARDLSSLDDLAHAMREAIHARENAGELQHRAATELARDQKRNSLWENAALKPRAGREPVPVESLYVDDVLSFDGKPMRVSEWVTDPETGRPIGVNLEGPYGRKFVDVNQTLHPDKADSSMELHEDARATLPDAKEVLSQQFYQKPFAELTGGERMMVYEYLGRAPASDIITREQAQTSADVPRRQQYNPTAERLDAINRSLTTPPDRAAHSPVATRALQLARTAATRQNALAQTLARRPDGSLDLRKISSAKLDELFRLDQKHSEAMRAFLEAERVTGVSYEPGSPGFNAPHESVRQARWQAIDARLNDLMVRLDAVKMDTSGQLHAFGLLPATWNALIDLVKAGIKGGLSVGKAIDAAFGKIKEQFPKETFEEEKAREFLNERFGHPLRQYGEKVLGSDVAPNVQTAVRDYNYAPRSNEADADFAKRLVQEHGVDKAMALYSDRAAALPGAVQSMLGDAITEQLSKEIGLAAGKDALRAELAEKQARFIDQQLRDSTEVAQTLQAMRRIGLMSVPGLVRLARRTILQAGDAEFQRHKPVVDEIGKELDAAQAEAIEGLRQDPGVNQAARAAVDETVERSIETHRAVVAEVTGAWAQSPVIVNELKRQLHGRVNEILQSERPKPGVELRKRFDAMMGDLMDRVVSIANGHYQLAGERGTGADFGRTLAEKIRERTGLSKKHSEQLAATMDKRFAELVEKAKTKLKQRIATQRAKRELASTKSTPSTRTAAELAAEGKVDAAIRQQLREWNLKLGEVVAQGDARTVGAKLGEHLLNETKLQGEAAKRLAQLLDARFHALATEAKRRRLEALGKTITVPRKIREAYEKLIEAHNLGGFKNQKHYDIVREKLGLAGVDAGVRRGDRNRLADDRQETAGGFSAPARRDAVAQQRCSARRD